MKKFIYYKEYSFDKDGNIVHWDDPKVFIRFHAYSDEHARERFKEVKN